MSCNFCDNVFQKNREQGLPEEESVLYQDENIYVMPDISPLSVGHLLIISRKHFQGFASADKETLASVETFFQYYRKRIGHRAFTVFEHGAVYPFSAGASIDHAHMHIIPFNIDIKERITQEFGIPRKCNLRDIPVLRERMQPYFFCMKGEEKDGWVFEVNVAPSQILRKLANELLDEKSDYNWKVQYQNIAAHTIFYKTLIWWKSLVLPDNFKWKKKLLLEKYGFVDYKGLLNEITRFSKDDRNLLLLLLEKELELRDSLEIVFRIVLVPLYHQYYLPNFLIKERADLCGLEKFYATNPLFTEIWCLENRVEDMGRYSGRLSVLKQGSFSEIIIEMIVGDNLRNLDQYSLGKGDMKYFRARKKMGGICFEIEENRMSDLEEEIQKVFEWVKIEVAMYNDKIQFLCECLHQYGIHVLSMDFRVEDKKIVFIDWDTSDDEMVLRHELS